MAYYLERSKHNYDPFAYTMGVEAPPIWEEWKLTVRALVLSIFLAMAASVIAQQPASPSEELKNKFLAIFERHITDMMMEMRSHAAQPPQPPQPDEVAKVVQGAMKEIRTSYGGIIMLPDSEARRLLTTGPDDEANIAAMQGNLEKWKQVALPKPVLLDRMQKKVAAGQLKGGLDLELTQRISEFHLRQLGVIGP